MRIRYLIITGMLLIMFSIPIQAKAEVITLQTEIEEQLVCQDDCGMLVSACDNSTAQYMRDIIKEQISLGKNKEEVLQHFIGIYGETVLAAPPARGFNLMAWITPFFIIFLGGLLTYLTLDKWVSNNTIKELDSKKDIKKNSLELQEYQQDLEEELKKYW